MTTTQNPYCALLQGRQLHQYLIGDYLGGGEFSLVFKGQDLNTGKPVAVKILPPAPSSGVLFEFLREADLLAKLQAASNVVNLRGTGIYKVSIQQQGNPGPLIPLPFHYHALDLAGGTLDDIVRSLANFTLAERLRLWRSVVRGVHQMHLSEVVHRDLKSSNCLVFPDRDLKERVQVADLGRASDTKLPHHFPTQEYVMGRGDYLFAPPECLYQQAHANRAAWKSADLYGLGSLLFEMVTGQGITSAALGYGPAIVAQARRQPGPRKPVDLSYLLYSFNNAFEQFEVRLPNVVRPLAGPLLRQLCHPVPESRMSKRRLGSREVPASDLQWLLRRADIICKAAEAPRSKKLTPRKVVS